MPGVSGHPLMSVRMLSLTFSGLRARFLRRLLGLASCSR
jgi:hypothetical protein